MESTYMLWNSNSDVVSPVKLSADPDGYIIILDDIISKRRTFIDTATIQDAMLNSDLSLPKSTRVRNQFGASQDDVSLKKKTIRVLCGQSYVPDNPEVVCFYLLAENIKIAMKCHQMFLSFIKNSRDLILSDHISKIYAKIRYGFASPVDNTISPKKIIYFLGNREVLRQQLMFAIRSVRLDTKRPFSASKFTREKFDLIFKTIFENKDINSIFLKLSGDRDHISPEAFLSYLHEYQVNSYRISSAEPSKPNRGYLMEVMQSRQRDAQGRMYIIDFYKFFFGKYGCITQKWQKPIETDDTFPLNHYYIESSHNSYLTGHQLRGHASAQMYRQILLLGCRCVELDIWNSPTGPIILHGNCLVKPVAFEEVIDAIAETAFVTSPYPIILSLENHCSAENNEKMAAYMKQRFGDMLLTEPLDRFPLKCTESPRLNCLKYKILVKGKVAGDSVKDNESIEELTEEDVVYQRKSLSLTKDMLNEMAMEVETVAGVEYAEQATSGSLSKLINYITAIKFTTFNDCFAKKQAHGCVSLNEIKAISIIASNSRELMRWNSTQYSRIYPAPNRFSSTNFNPFLYWCVGCSMVALNYQTPDLGMQLNHGLFDVTDRMGYYLKPPAMLNIKSFNPFSSNLIDGVIAARVEIKVLSLYTLVTAHVSGPSFQFNVNDASTKLTSSSSVQNILEEMSALSLQNEIPFVCRISTYGILNDTNKEVEIRIVQANGFQHKFESNNTVVFPKILLPSITVIHISVLDRTREKILGHFCCPVSSMSSGIKYCILRNVYSQQINLMYMFLHVMVTDYVPKSMEAIAFALTTPKSQDNDDKHKFEAMVFEQVEEYPRKDSSPQDEEDDQLQTRLLQGDDAYVAGLANENGIDSYLIWSHLDMTTNTMLNDPLLSNILTVDEIYNNCQKLFSELNGIEETYLGQIRQGGKSFNNFMFKRELNNIVKKSKVSRPAIRSKRISNNFRKVKSLVYHKARMFKYSNDKIHTVQEIKHYVILAKYDILSKELLKCYKECIQNIKLVYRRERKLLRGKVGARIKSQKILLKKEQATKPQRNHSRMIEIQNVVSLIKQLDTLFHSVMQRIEDQYKKNLDIFEDDKQKEINCILHTSDHDDIELTSSIKRNEDDRSKTCSQNDDYDISDDHFFEESSDDGNDEYETDYSDYDTFSNHGDKYNKIISDNESCHDL
ncbi:hypothetical protein GJ496_009559 [Pomphorhynchus laevis]|nr:hypothetical protein GJ496_009559 [Pomphorhynchus laevis]